MSSINGNNLNLPSHNSITLGLDPSKFIVGAYREIHAFLNPGSNTWSINTHDESLAAAIAAMVISIGKIGDPDTRYKIFTIPLDAAQVDVPVGLAAAVLTGKSMTVLTLTGSATIRFNFATYDVLTLVPGMIVNNLKMVEIYISNAPQVGKVAVLWVQGN